MFTIMMQAGTQTQRFYSANTREDAERAWNTFDGVWYDENDVRWCFSDIIEEPGEVQEEEEPEDDEVPEDEAPEDDGNWMGWGFKDERDYFQYRFGSMV